MQECISQHPHNFSRIGKFKGQKVEFHIDPNVKPVAAQQQSTPHHVKDKPQLEIQEISLQNVLLAKTKLISGVWYMEEIISF